MNTKDYKDYLLKSIFYDVDSIISFFGENSSVGKKISYLKNKFENNNNILEIVSSKLETLILNKNSFIIKENNKALKSIFTTFKKHRQEDKKIDDTKYYPLSVLKNNTIIYPNEIKNDSLADYENYINDLDLEKISNSENINTILNTLSNIFSYVPYFKNGECGIGDISFYDKLKINTALSSCLYLLKDRDNSYDTVSEDKKHFVLLSGDISGIQKFIYTISSKGALKSLRARSFYLEIMLEHIADEILEYFNLTRCNLLYTGGGHFYIILPNYEKTDNNESISDIINKIMHNLNDWFIKNFSIDLYIAIGIEEFDFNDLKDFASVFKKLSNKLSKIKQRRYITNDNNIDQLVSLLDPHNNVAEFECSICHTSSKTTYKREIFSDEEEVYICDTCFNLYKAGKYMLSDNESIFVVNKIDGLDKDKIVDLPSLYSDKNDRYLYFGEINNGNFIRAYTKNNANNYINLFLGDYNFKENESDENLINFETLVKGEELRGNKSFGINRLAVLRCDVDSLGDAFMNGFRGYADILRTSSFSRHLSLFFKYYINFVCYGDVSFPNNKLFNDKYFNKEKRAVIVYAGGDDVFLVGQWLDVINLTLDLRESFRRYTNDSLTFSAGIGFFHTKYPVSKMASQTGELEELAKNKKNEKNENGKKDSVALFGKPYSNKLKKEEEEEEFRYTFNWSDFKEVKEKIDFLFSVCYFEETEFDKEKIFFSTSLMYRLKQLIEVYINDKDGINIARLAYSLARISHTNENKNNYEKFKNTVYEWFTNKNKEDLKYLNTALDLIIYLFRDES